VQQLLHARRRKAPRRARQLVSLLLWRAPRRRERPVGQLRKLRTRMLLLRQQGAAGAEHTPSNGLQQLPAERQQGLAARTSCGGGGHRDSGGGGRRVRVALETFPGCDAQAARLALPRASTVSPGGDLLLAQRHAREARDSHEPHGGGHHFQ
jgi:hypothetical protein